MRLLILIILVVFSADYSRLAFAAEADEGLVRTINYQGFLVNEETGAPLSGTFTIQVSMHQVGIRPPYSPPPSGNAEWQEYHEKMTVRDGIFTLRLGLLSPLSKELFDGTKDIQMTFGVVPYGTGRSDYSYLGPMQIDGHAYSVSSVGVRGSDIKTGTVEIQAKPYSSDNFAALLELKTDPALAGVIPADYRYRLELRHISTPGSATATGLLIQIARGANGLPLPLKTQDRNAVTPYGTEPLFDTLSPVLPGNVGAYVRNGIAEFQALSIHPLMGGAIKLLPGDLEASSINVSGKVQVREIVMTAQNAGLVEGSSLKNCFHNQGSSVELDDCLPIAGELHYDNQIDPYPTDQQLLDGVTSRLNALEIRGSEISPGQLHLKGAEATATSTGYLRMTSGLILAPVLRSPYDQSETQLGPYKIAPDGLTVLDSAILVSDRAGSPDARSSVTPEQAVASPLNAYTVFDLVSLAPLCLKDGQYQMALREDYCASVPLADDRYREADPCRDNSGNALPIVGIPVSCYASFQQWTHPNQGYLVESHVHDADSASASLLIDLINASSAGKRIERRLLPEEAVSRFDPVSLTAENIFDGNIYVRGSAVASMLNLNQAEILGDSQSLTIRANNLSNVTTPTLYLQNPAFSTVGQTPITKKMTAHAGNAFLGETRIVRDLKINKAERASDSRYPLDVSRSLYFEQPTATNRYFYLPQEVTVTGDVYFSPSSVLSERKLLNLLEVGVQNQIFDLTNPSYYLHFSSLSRVNSLQATGDIRFRGQVSVSGNANFQAEVRTLDLSIANDLRSERLSDLDDPSYYLQPVNSSRLRGLRIQQSLKTLGKLSMLSDVEIGQALNVNGNFSTSGSISLSNPTAIVEGRRLVKAGNPLYVIDPDKASRLRGLSLVGDANWDILQNLTLSQNLHHRAFSEIQGTLTVSNRSDSRLLYDRDDFVSLLDPSSVSLISSLRMEESIQSLGATSFATSVSIGTDLLASDSLEVMQRLTVSRDYIYRQSIRIQNGVSIPFSVDETGHLRSQSISLVQDLFLQDLAIAGSLRVENGSVNINIPTSMQTMRVVTHSLFGYRSNPNPPGPMTGGGAGTYISTNPTTVESAFSLSSLGELRLHHELNLQGSVGFSDTVSLFGNTTELVLSDNSSSLTTVLIGAMGQKDLGIGGLSGRSLQATTLVVQKISDRDDPTQRFLDPDQNSQIQTLRISHDLSIEGRLVAPQFLDLDNAQLVNPDGFSELGSLRIMGDTTAEHLSLPGFNLLATHQSSGQTLVDLQSLTISKSLSVVREGITTFTASNLHFRNTTGIVIADLSAGSGVLLSPGDLRTLLDGSNADYLHTHDSLGGVPLYDFARRDVHNTVPLSERTSQTLAHRALEDWNRFTASGLVLQIAPRSPVLTRPVFAVLRPDGSAVATLTESGLLTATGFHGSGAGLLNVPGGAFAASAFQTGTIAGSRVASQVLDSALIALQNLQTRHFAQNSISGRSLMLSAFASNAVAPLTLLSANLGNQSVTGHSIISATINSRIVSDSAIQSRHLSDHIVGNGQIAARTISSRAIGLDAVSSVKILDNSIEQSRVSTAAVDSSKVRPNSLVGSSFASDIISDDKIQTDAIDTSKFALKTLTNSDFALSAVSSVQFEDFAIYNSAIATNNLTTVAFADRAVSFDQIGNSQVQNIDISALAILANTNPLEHKVANQAITSDKILNLNIIGDHFEQDTITLSKLASNTVSTAQVLTGSIANIDIASYTLMGEKIQDQSFVTTQFADASILNPKIDDNIFGPAQISPDSLDFVSIGDATLTLAKIAANTILTTHIKDLSLEDNHFAEQSLTLPKWQLNTITSIKIATDAANLSKMRTGSVDSLRVATAQITTVAIAPLSISSIPLGARQIPNQKFANGSIETQDIGDSQIDARVVAPSSIYSTNLVDLAITASKIPSLLLSSGVFATDAITHTKIGDGQITFAKIADQNLISSHFALLTLSGVHIDANSVSGRTLLTQNLLTTHIMDFSIRQAQVASLQIDSRIVLDGSIDTDRFLTESLTGSDFAQAIVTGGNVLTGAVTNQKIVSYSIDSGRFLTHTLQSRHVHPSTLTSQSLGSLAISSDKILNDSLPYSIMVSFEIADHHLAPTALSTRVFAANAVTSANFLDDTLLTADFANASVTLRQTVTNTLENSEFSLGSLLTTHLMDYSLSSREFTDLSFDSGRIEGASAVTKGLHSLVLGSEIRDISKVAMFSDKDALLFSASGVYLRDFASGTIEQVSSLALTPAVVEVISPNHIWVAVGPDLYYSPARGRGLRIVHTFSQDILSIQFQNQHVGIITTRHYAHITRSAGQNFRQVFNGANVMTASSLDNLRLLWVLQQNGAVYHSSDEGENWALIRTLTPGFDQLLLRMNSGNDGYAVLRNTGSGAFEHYSTVNNWAGFSLFSTTQNFAGKIHLQSDSDLWFFLENGAGYRINSSAAFIPNVTAVSRIHDSFIAHDSADALFLTSMTGHGNHYQLVFSAPVPGEMNAQAYGLSAELATDIQISRIQFASDDALVFQRGNRVLRSSDGGITFSPMAQPLVGSPLHSIHFFDDDNGFMARQDGSIQRTTNGGLSFAAAVSVAAGSPLTVYAYSANRGFALDYSGQRVIVDTGDNFSTLVTVNVGHNIRASSLAGTNVLWAGDNGYFGAVGSGGAALFTRQLPAPFQNQLSGISGSITTGVWLTDQSGNVLYIPPDVDSAPVQNFTNNASSSGISSLGVCAAEASHILIHGPGNMTKMSWDGGLSFQSVIPLDMQAQHFTSCSIKTDGTMGLASTANNAFLLRVGSGLDGDRIQDFTLTNALLSDGMQSEQLRAGTFAGQKLSTSSVTGDKLVSRSLLTSHLDNASISGAAVSAQTITNRIFADASVTNAKIGTDISGSKIGDNIVLGQDFGGLSLTSAVIRTNSLAPETISVTNANALTHGTFMALAVTAQNLHPASFYGSRLINETLTDDNFSDHSLNGYHIQTNTIDSSRVADGSISIRRLYDRQVDSSHLAATGTIPTVALAEAGYWGDRIIDGSLTSASLADGQFDSGQFQSRVFSGNLIADNSIDDANIMTRSIERSHFATNSVRGADFVSGSITMDQIADGVITSSIIQDNSIEAFQVATGVLISSKIHSQSVSSAFVIATTLTSDVILLNDFSVAKIVAGTMTNSLVAAHTLTSGHFQNLNESSMATGAFATTMASLYWPDNSSGLSVVSVKGSVTQVTAIASVGASPHLSHARFSADGSKVVFALREDGLWKLAFADSGFTFVRRLQISSASDLVPGLQWDRNGYDFYYKIQGQTNVYKYNTNTHQATDTGFGFAGPTTQQIRFAQGQLNSFQTRYIYRFGDRAYHSNAGCDVADTAVDITITPDGSRAAMLTNAGVVRVCNLDSGTLITSTNLGAITLMMHPSDNEHLWYINTSNRLAYAPIDSLSPETQFVSANATFKQQAFIAPGHVFVDRTIASSQIPSATITSGKLAPLSFGNLSFVASPVVTAGHLQAESIKGAHIESLTLVTSKFKTGSLTHGHLMDGILAGEHFLASEITSASLAAESVRAGHLMASQILNPHFANNSVIDAKVANNQILTRHLTNDAVNASALIAAGVITGSKIAENVVTSGHVVDSTLISSHITAATIPGSKFTATLSEPKLDSRILHSRHFSSGFVDGSRLSDNSIAPTPAMIVLLGAGQIYLSGPDIEINPSLINTGFSNWTALRRTVHGNQLIASNSASQSFVVHTTSGSRSEISTLDGSSIHLRNRVTGNYYHYNAGNIIVKDDRDIPVASYAADDSGFDLHPDHGTLIYIRNGNQLWTQPGGMVSSSGTTLQFPRYGVGNRIVLIEDNKVVTYNGSFTTIYNSSGTVLYLSPSQAQEVVYVVALEGGVRVVHRLRTDVGSAQTSVALRSFTAALPEGIELLDYSAIEHNGITALNATEVTETQLAQRSFGAENFASATLTTAKFLNGSLSDRVIADNQITSGKISGSITQDRITSQAILSEHISDGSVLNAHLVDDSLLTRNFAPFSLVRAKLAAGNITNAQLLNSTVTETRFTAETITNAAIAANVVTSGKIANAQLVTGKVTNGAIDNGKISDDSLGESVFSDGAVISAHIQNNTISSTVITAGSLTDASLADGALTDNEVPTNGINNSNYLQDGAFNGDRFQSGIPTAKLGVLGTASFADGTFVNLDFSNSISSNKIAFESLVDGSFTANTLVAAEFATGAITKDHINAGYLLPSSKFANGAFTLAKILNGTVSGAAFDTNELLTADINSLSGSSFNRAITAAKVHDTGSFVLTTSHFGTGDKIVQDDFTTTFVDSRVTADGSITNSELAVAHIVTASGNGLRAANNQIQAAHLAGSSLEGANIAAGAISDTMIENSIPVAKIPDNTLQQAKIGTDLTGAKFVDGAFGSTHIQAGLFANGKFANSQIQESNISTIGGDEIQDGSLDGNSIVNNSLTTADLAAGDPGKLHPQFRNVLNIHLANGVFSSLQVEDGVLGNAAIDTGNKIAQGKTYRTDDANHILRAGLPSNTIAYVKLNTAAGVFFNLFGNQDADANHTHNVLDQPVACPTGYTLVKEDSSGKGNSFCISAVQANSTLKAHRDSAKALSVTPTFGSAQTVNGQVCSIEQLMSARRAGFTVTDNAYSSTLTIDAAGFSGVVRAFNINNFNPSSGTGSLTMVDPSVSGPAHYCL